MILLRICLNYERKYAAVGWFCCELSRNCLKQKHCWLSRLFVLMLIDKPAYVQQIVCASLKA